MTLMTPRTVACAALVVAVFGVTAQTTPPTTPEPVRQSAPATRAPMVAAAEPTLAAIEAQLEVAARPETAERLAAFKRNLYEALLKKGFNGQDAMLIVIATPLPAPWPATPQTR